MALEVNNKSGKKKVPITRNNKFFGAEDFDLEMGFATEYLEQDANQTVILYRVDLQKTQVNDIYHEAEANKVRFLTPIEIPVVYEVGESEMKAYNSKMQKGLYALGGKLTFSVLLTTLEEYDCDISRGDYIGVQVDSETRVYYVVTDDGRVASNANKFTLYGTKPYARTIQCGIVDKDEFNG